MCAWPGVLQVDWETMWRERLADYARPQEGKAALGWSTKVTVEVSFVVAWPRGIRPASSCCL
jgi:hypothetical protein